MLCCAEWRVGNGPLPDAPKGRATYAEALPGVDVAYTAMPEGVREELVLHDIKASTSYDFTVSMSPGLTAWRRPRAASPSSTTPSPP